MTSTALRQFISLIGGDNIAKGAVMAEPSASFALDKAFVMGQTDYLAGMIRGIDTNLYCPFERHTALAGSWAAGKLYERRCERAAVEALQAEARRVA